MKFLTLFIIALLICSTLSIKIYRANAKDKKDDEYCLIGEAPVEYTTCNHCRSGKDFFGQNVD
jgi:hypothetical protein